MITPQEGGRRTKHWSGQTKPDMRQHLLDNKVVNEQTSCWEWTNAFRSRDCRRKTKTLWYPVITYKNKKYNAHRLAYLTLVGPIAEGLVVRHSCHNPICINPDHLSLGTQQDNVNDSLDRIRAARSRLTPQDVAAIRDMLKQGMSASQVAREFNVSRTNIRFIGQHKRWKEASL